MPSFWRRLLHPLSMWIDYCYTLTLKVHAADSFKYWYDPPNYLQVCVVEGYHIDFSFPVSYIPHGITSYHLNVPLKVSLFGRVVGHYGVIRNIIYCIFDIWWE
jgi:hypothetical protein